MAAKHNDESAAGLEMMTSAAEELGVKFDKPITPKPAAAPADGEETEEERLAREEAGIDENGDTAEEREAAAAAKKKDGGDEAGAEGEETDEEKEARQAAETPEEKAAREEEEAAAAEGEETEEEKAAREKADAAKDPAKKEKAEAAAIVALKLKDLPPEVQTRAKAVINDVIGRVVAKERGESERLGSRVTELTTELEAEQKKKGPTIVGSVNPAFMADDTNALDDRVLDIEKFERWARKHANGFEGDEAKGEASYTAEQIEARLEQLLEEKNKIIPAARKNLQARTEIDKNLRTVYPAIFDPKSEEYAQVQQVLKVLPELKQFADYRVIALKQILGGRALAAHIEKWKKEQSPNGSKKKQPDPKASKKTPPRAPGHGSTAKGSVLSREGGKPAASAAVSKFTSGESSLEDTVGSLLNI